MTEHERIVKRVLTSEDGKHLLNYLTDKCNVYRNTYAQGDTHATAFNEGVRSVALHLLELAGRNAQILTEDKLKKGSNPWLNQIQNRQ